MSKPFRVSVYDPSGTDGQPVRAMVKLDDENPAIPNVGIEYGFVLVFDLPDSAVYTHGAWLDIELPTRQYAQRVILEPHIIVDVPADTPEPPEPLVGRTGIVRTNRKVLFDNEGTFHPLGASFFWALQSWRNDRDRCKRNAEFLAPYVDYFRILCEVGTGGNPASSWAGNTIEPKEWPDYQEILAWFMHWVYTQLGKRVELTVLGKGTNTDPLWLSHQIADVIADNRQHMVMNVEMANEHFSGDKISIPTMRQMAAIFKSKVPNILALSNPDIGNTAWDAMDEAAQNSGLAGFTVHPRRKFLDAGWAHVRQGYDNKNTRLAVMNNEPAGPGSSVEQMTNIIQLVMTRAVGVMCGGAGYVFHTGTGVFGDGKSHITAGVRPANFWEIPDVDIMLHALRSIDRLLPAEVENWSVKNTQRAGIPFDAPKSAHWGEGNEDSSGWGINKAYAAVSSTGEFIQMPLGVKSDLSHPCRMTAQFRMSNVTVYDPLTLSPMPGLENRTFAAGERLTLPGSISSMVAYIIQGRRA